MKHTLNILTRCTRPNNLLKVKESVFTDIPKNLKIKWHVIFDVAPLKDIDAELLSELTNEDTQLYFIKGGDGGLLYPQSTEIIKGLNPKSWFYFLDDDNILHENFYNHMSTALNEGGKKIHVVSQKVDGKDFTRLDVRVASPENTGFRKTDIAQAVISTELISKYEFGADYAADGYFIEAVLTEEPEVFSYHNEILSYYNYLDKEATPKLPRVLYIGEGEPNLETSKVLDYEANELTVKYLKDDLDVIKVIAEFKPDSIITVGESFKSFPILASLPLQFRRKWINIDNEEDLQNVGNIAYGVSEQAMLDPTNMNDESLISFFTPIYNTKEKLYETYQSVAAQTYPNWEWVLMNDSTDGGRTLKIAEDIAKNDPRVKIYDLREKSGGCIGEVKWRACAMARGYIVAELDHDDLLAENCAMDLHNAAQAHPECGFFYGDTAEVTEEWENNKYGPGFALGYGNYRDEEYKGRKLSPANQQNINPKTIRHIVGVPNHIRAWRRTTYFEIGGHNRSLTVVDDYELIVRTFLNTIMCKIPKLSYIQFLYNNAGGRNTHDLSRADIQRRTRTIAAHYNEQIKARFEELGQHDWAYEEAPHYPIHAESRYGEDEGYVNVVFKG
tara:strand:- start:5313 stop:7157 length:1845 start_codon:yes stop_codon:yes gene_type:complete